MSEQQIWDLWIPDVAAQGVSFARGRLNAADVLLIHAAPEKLTVEVYDDNRVILAQGTDLSRTANTPMTRHVESRDPWAVEICGPFLHPIQPLAHEGLAQHILFDIHKMSGPIEDSEC